MKTIKGDLILKKNTVFNESLTVEGNIIGNWDLNCKDLNCWNLNCWNLNCNDLNCNDLNCKDLNCGDLNCNDLNCRNLNCEDLNFYAIAITYSSFKCNSWKARRDNHIIKCLDGKIKVKSKEKEE